MTYTAHRRRRHQHLVVVDIENIAGTPTPTTEEVETAIQRLRDAIPGFQSAQRVWACSHRAARTVGFAVPTDRQLWRSGIDGADMALLEVIDTEQVEQRYEQVTVCSGDGIFADSVARLTTHGVTVNVVALRGHTSAKLRLAAHQVTYLRQADSILGTAS